MFHPCFKQQSLFLRQKQKKQVVAAQKHEYVCSNYKKQLMKYFVLIFLLALQISCQTCSITQSCDSVHVWDPHTCKCCCKQNTCVFPREQNPSDCSCKCPKSHLWDQTSQACICGKNITCPTEKVFSPEKCRCTSLDEICSSTKTYDNTTNTCVCKAQPSSCVSPKILNPNSCECVCPNSPLPTSCTADQVWNKSTCSCKDKVKCILPLKKDAETNTCVCGIKKCPQKKTLDTVSCQCV